MIPNNKNTRQSCPHLRGVAKPDEDNVLKPYKSSAKKGLEVVEPWTLVESPRVVQPLLFLKESFVESSNIAIDTSREFLDNS